MASGYAWLSQIKDPIVREAVRQILDRLGIVEGQAADVGKVTQKLSKPLDAGLHQINKVRDPTRPTDAATKSYVDKVVVGQVQSILQQQAATPAVVSPPTGPDGTTPTPVVPSTPPDNPTPVPSGPNRGNTRIFMDNGGNFLAFGASLFWGLWGFINDRDRLAQNLGVLRNGGVSYIRCLGAVGPAGGWDDRVIDPGAADYGPNVAAFTDWVYEQFSMRVQWTIIGDVNAAISSSAARSNLMTSYANMALGREHKIFAFEVCNEPGNGPKIDLNELRSLTANLQNATTVLVAAGAGNSADCAGAYGQFAIYQGGVGDFMTWHFDRSISGGCTVWRPVRQPWDAQFCAGVPVLVSNNEPIGPESSVASESDPLRLASAAAESYLAGVGAYVLHCGAGIRGGGAADLARGRKANFWEYGSLLDQIFQANRNVRTIMDADTPNWDKHNTNNNYPNRPWDFVPSDADAQGLVCRMHNATSGNLFVSLPHGITQNFAIRARRNMSNVRQYDILSGAVLQEVALSAGQDLALTPAQGAYLIRGVFA